MRYPNSFDCVTWTFDGVPVLRNVWMSLAQIFNRVEIEYLPVYNPNEKERKDPGLFAENVRRVMAEALDVPTSNLQFEDGHLITKMRESHLVQKLRGIYRAKKALGMIAPSASSYESAAILQNSLKRNQFLYSFQQFQREFFNVTSAETTIPEVQTAFNYFKKPTEPEAVLIDIRPYLILTCILYEDRAIRMEDMSKRLCELYDIPAAETTDENLKRILSYVFEVTDEEAPMPAPSHTASVEALAVPAKTNGISEPMKRRISLYLDFAKLFADEVADRLPKTYPTREQRDKPSRKKHLD